MPHIEVPGARIHYETAGRHAAPALLLVHSGLASLRMWDPVVDELSREHLVIRYDLRGSGATECDDMPFSERDDARDVLDHLGVASATVVGSSLGGRIGLDLALESPERVDGLVLVGAGVSGFPETELTDDEDELSSALDRALEAEEWAAATDTAMRIWAVGPRRDPADVDPDFLEDARLLGRLNIPRLADRATPIPLEPPAFERVVDVAAPALTVVGEHDVSRTLLVHEFLADGIPHADSCVIADAAHLPSVERPGAFLACLEPWLERNGL